MNEVSDTLKEMIDLMNEFYKSHRTRCLALRWKDTLYNLHLSRSWQPFEVTDAITQQHDTGTLFFMEAISNRRDDNPTSIFESTEVSIGKEKVVLCDSAHKWNPRSDQMYPNASKSSVGYLCTSPGIVLRDSTNLLGELQGLSKVFEHEIKFHPVIPFRHFSSYLQTFGVRDSGDAMKKTEIEEFMPFWASIEEMKVKATKVFAKYRYHQSMENRLGAYLTTETIDGYLETQKKGVEEGERKNVEYGITEINVVYTIPPTFAPAKRVRLALSIDDRYSLHFRSEDIGPPKLDLWTILRKLEHSEGRIAEMLEGERGQVHIDKFEFGIGLLLSSLGFRILYTGRIFEPGPDLLAVSRDDSSILIVECGRKKIEQKMSDCSERVDEFRKAFPQYDYIGLVFTSSTISDERRREIVTPGIVLMDEKDIKLLRDIAVRIPNPEVLLDSFNRAMGGSYRAVFGIRR